MIVENGRAEPQDLEAQALHGALERHGRIDDLQRLPRMDVLRRVADLAHIEGAADGLPRHVGRDGHDVAVVVDDEKAVVAVARHEGYFAIMDTAGLCAKAEPVGHGLLGYGASGKNEELIARFCENLLKNERNGTRTQLRVSLQRGRDDGPGIARYKGKQAQKQKRGSGEPYRQKLGRDAAF